MVSRQRRGWLGGLFLLLVIIVVSIGSVLDLSIPAFRRAIPFPVGTVQLLSYTLWLLSYAIGIWQREPWPLLFLPLRIIAALIVFADTATLALLFTGTLTQVPAVALILTPGAFAGCLLAVVLNTIAHDVAARYNSRA